VDAACRLRDEGGQHPAAGGTGGWLGERGWLTVTGAPAAGLCASCTHARTITNRRGSSFLLCGLSSSDPAFPRYPRLPVLLCAGWRPRPGEPGDDPANPI